MTELTTITKPSTAELDIKKSRFIGAVMPCSTQQQAAQQLNQLIQQHAQANHLAFAWRIRQADGVINERCHDGGEPSGTAGRPILAPLAGDNRINIVVGVIRYFGGIKLGTGGLTRAYGQAAKQAIADANWIEWVEMAQLKLTLDYNELQRLEYQLKKCQGQILANNLMTK